ncbi:MAG TPA: 2-C-methyl-D-erythritol 4-phosphate cytidylyltransferase, partial [Alphaproteobacteria bacterium]
MATSQGKNWASIVVAAGAGTRFGTDLPKQYANLAGRPILDYALKALQSVGPIVLVVDPSHQPLYAPLAVKYPNIRIVNGGATRQESVKAGLKRLNDAKPQYVMIHDAARPLLSNDALSRIQSAVEAGAKNATLAVPVIDTLIRGNDVIDRNGVQAIQTPQAFPYDLAMNAHDSAQKNYTDDAGLVFGETGADIQFVQGDAENFKITTPEDLERAERILLARLPETRTGLGFDVHRFGDAPVSGTIKLFGADIPSDKSLIGHSDADAGLHAIADAILGTIGAGDIGLLFPPSDPQWKGMDSAIIVQKALDLLHAKDGVLRHVDIMLMAEEPRIGKHRDVILEKLSNLLSLPSDAIGLKATTTEKMGFIGRSEGLAVQAIVTVR